MADSLHGAASSLQPPATQSSSLSTGDDVLAGSRRSSASRATAGSLSPATTASTLPQPIARVPSHGPIPQLPRRHGQSPENTFLSNAPSPSPRQSQNYELSSSPSNSNSPSNIPTRHGSNANANAARAASHRTSHRHNRSSGTFLLNDALGSGSRAAHTRSSQRESTSSNKNRNSVGRAAGASLRVPPETPEKTTAVSSPSPANNSTPDSTHSSGSSRRSHGSSAASSSSATAARSQTPESAASALPTSASAPVMPGAPTNQPLDLDSAQIVNMALNLSESRRIAARRNVSQQLPPRLAPLPDSAVGGSLLRQLQQQRRISRTMSPKPDRAGGNRVSSSGQLPPGQNPRMSTSSALQAPFELMPDGTPAGQGPYRYHFSQSTLARAQKAKDYLELLAQHRRLLDFIPPLTPAAASRSRATSLGSPPTTSTNAGQPQSLFLTGTNSNGDLVVGSTRLGRPYNPLQYIRNRKVRVRERRAIDGQAQGFGDVTRATEWVDEVAKWTATGQGRMLGGYTLPSYITADADAALQSSPPPASSRTAGQSVAAKPKRPRIDWIIDPADMIADVYWLEQGDNKKLVEDHHWRRVFPQDSALYRPVSQRADEIMPGTAKTAVDQADLAATFPAKAADGDVWAATNNGSGSKPLYAMPVGAHLKPVEASPEPDHSSARKRARQKLSELRSFHHRHNSSVHSQEVQRIRRGSFSDTSDSDNDRVRFSRTRADSGTANGAEVMNKAMMNKIAKENRENDESAAAAAAVASAASAASVSKEQKRTSAHKTTPSVSGTPTNGKAAKHPESATAAQPSGAAAAIDSPSKQGRASLEVPTVGRRLSLDYDSSRPTSPELRPFSKDGLGFVPPLGGDLSPPPSRAASPPRHRFGKVKSIFRDHSRERERDRDRATTTALDRGEDYIEPTRVSTQPVQHHHQHQAQPSQQQYQEYVESTSAPLTAVSTVADDLRFASSNEAEGPHSPIRKSGTRPGAGTFDTHRSHNSLTNISGHLHSSNTNHSTHGHHNHQRSEEGGSSGGTLRGLFKGGPRIDTMLRSGVSKVSDMLWRREGSEPPYGEPGAGAMSSSDPESESDAAPRGRFRKSPLPSRSPSTHAGGAQVVANAEKTNNAAFKANEKHYLDVMPTFGRGEDPINRPPSRQSARFERLKPPRIDVRDASPSADDVANNFKQLGEPATNAAANASRRNSSLQPIGRQPQRGSQTQDSDYSESDTRSRRSSRVSGAASSISGSLAGNNGALQPLPRKFSSTSATGATGDRPRWSLSQPAYKNSHGSLSRRELARLRASMYSSAVLAKELSRRANEAKVLAPTWRTDGTANGNGKANGNGDAQKLSSMALSAPVTDTGAEADDEADHEHDGDDDAEAIPDCDGRCPVIVRGSNGEQSLTWADIAAYGPNPAELARRPVKQVELYPLAAQVLGSAIQRSGRSWQVSAEAFTNTTVPQLRQRIEGVRTRVAVELSGLARQAADEADEVTRDLMAVQRLQVKRVEDSIEKMLRRRRRRFRWVRRAGWLTVEWLLVGFMWYVWFVVMLARIVLGFGRGIYTGVRWLLWL